MSRGNNTNNNNQPVWHAAQVAEEIVSWRECKSQKNRSNKHTEAKHVWCVAEKMYVS